MAAIESLGGRLILMASRALARIARGPEDYARVYDRLLSAAREPVILHWLGDMFDPALAGYWGSRDIERRDERGGRRHPPQCREDRRHQDLAARQGAGNRDAAPPACERAHVYRRRLQLRGADCWRFAGHSHALLGIFDSIAPAASAALSALAARRRQPRSIASSNRRFRCRGTSSPRRRASTKPASCSWPGSTASRNTSPWSAGSRARARITHLAEVFRLADQAALLSDPERACARMKQLLALHGAA